MSLLSILVSGGGLLIAGLAALDLYRKSRKGEPGRRVDSVMIFGGLLVAALAFIQGMMSEAAAAESDRKIDAAHTTATNATTKAQRLGNDLAASQRKVAELLEVNGRLEKQLKTLLSKTRTRADMLTPERREKLLAALKATVPKRSVLVSISDEHEANELGLVLGDILEEAGCLYSDEAIRLIPIVTLYGVQVVDGGAGEAGHALTKALEDAGVPDVDRAVDPTLAGREFIVLQIGSMFPTAPPE